MKKQVLFPSSGNLFTTIKGGRSQAIHSLSTFLLFGAILLFGVQSAWGQIAQRGSATTNSVANTNGTTLEITKPTGVVSGDVMLLTIVQNETENGESLASPNLTGWTLVRDRTIRDQGNSSGDNVWFGSVYYRISDGTEGSSFSLGMHARCDMAIGTIVAFSGVASNALKPDGSNGGPFDVVPQITFNNANSATATAIGLTVTNNNSAVVMLAMVNNDRTYDTWSNSQTELFDNVTTQGDDASVGAAWTSCVSSGATNDRTVIISSSDYNAALLLVLRRASTLSVGTASSTPTVCINSALTSVTHATTGATGIGTATGLPAGVTAAWASNTITISGTPSQSGTFNYSIPLTGGCISATGTITVTAANTAGTASSTPTVCINTTLTNITRTTTGATGIGTATGLPAGVTAAWTSNTLTITGTPTASGTFNYSIPLIGGCGSVNATGTITVTGTNTAGLASSTPTVCINTAITSITHATTGATGIGTATGLPTGVTAAWGSNTITISGTPTIAGTFNYSIPLTGGCGSANATGTITVTAANTAGTASSTPTLCTNTTLTNITRTTNGATGIGTATGLPAGVTAAWASNTLTISGTPTVAGTFNYIIPLTGGCGSVNATGTITVLPSPTVVSTSSSVSTICAGGSVNLTSSATSNSNTATTILNQNFNSTPTGWTTTNTSSGGTPANAAFTLRANGYGYTYASDPVVTFNSNDNSQFYLTNSASQGSGSTTQTTLRSPSFSTVGLSAASLSFYQYFRSYSGTSAIVEISTNGTSWTTLTTYAADKGSASSFVQETINLSSYLNQASVSIRFRYNGGWGWYWAIDNVLITGTFSTPPATSFAWTSSTGAFTSSLQNPTAVSPSATTTYTVTATNNYGCTATANTNVTISALSSTTASNGDYIWKGATSTDWATASNWLTYNGSAYAVATLPPAAANKVIIPAPAAGCVATQPATITNLSGNAKDIVIESGASLGLSSATLSVSGNWTNNGTFNSGTGTVSFAGTTLQTIGGSSANNFYRLTLNNAAGAKLSSNASVSNILTLTNGVLDIANYNFDGLSSMLAGSGGSPSSYVRTSGSGEYRHSVGSAITTFPVGNATYNPCELTKATGSPISFGVRLRNQVTTDGTDSGLASSGPSIGRMWHITPATGYTSEGVTLGLIYADNASDFTTGFSNAAGDRQMFHYGSTWENISNLSGSATTGTYGIANYTYYRQPGVTNFSPFTISNFGAALPVELMSLDAQCVGENVIVAWKTASEHNSLNFVVERSEDGTSWSEIQMIAAAGNSNAVLEYAIEDEGAARGLNYYRLIQTNQDGAQKIYGPVLSNCGSDDNSFISFPNPGDGELTLVFNGNNFNGASILNVSDANGRMVRTVALEIQAGTTSVLIPDMELTPGVYYLQLVGNNVTSKIIKHSLR